MYNEHLKITSEILYVPVCMLSFGNSVNTTHTLIAHIPIRTGWPVLNSHRYHVAPMGDNAEPNSMSLTTVLSHLHSMYGTVLDTEDTKAHQ